MVYRSGVFGKGGLLAACLDAGRPGMYRTLLKAEKENRPLEATIKKTGTGCLLPTIFEEKVTKWAHARRKGRRCANRLEVVSQIQQYMEYSDIKPPKGSKSVEKTCRQVGAGAGFLATIPARSPHRELEKAADLFEETSSSGV